MNDRLMIRELRLEVLEFLRTAAHRIGYLESSDMTMDLTEELGEENRITWAEDFREQPKPTQTMNRRKPTEDHH